MRTIDSIRSEGNSIDWLIRENNSKARLTIEEAASDDYYTYQIPSMCKTYRKFGIRSYKGKYKHIYTIVSHNRTVDGLYHTSFYI